MTHALATIETSMKALTFTSDEVQFIKEKYAPNSTDLEFKEFVALCQIHNANPLKKEVFFIKYGDGANARATIVFSYHWLLSRAIATGLYKGLTLPEYADEEGNWYTLWKDRQKMPIACKIGVFTKGADQPTYAIVYWAERAKNQAEWKNQPLHMLMKCAVVAALKLAIPDLSGLYTQEEMMEDSPHGEWVPDPEKKLSENVHDLSEHAKEKVAEKKRFQNGDLREPDDTEIGVSQWENICRELKKLGIPKAEWIAEINMRLKATDHAAIEKSSDLTVVVAAELLTMLQREVKALRETQRIEGDASDDSNAT